jgi:hypothetical protein
MYNKRCGLIGMLLLLLMLLPSFVTAEPQEPREPREPPGDGSQAQEKKLSASPEPAGPSPASHPTSRADSREASSGTSWVFSERDKANFKIVAGVLYRLVKGSRGNLVWTVIKLSAPEQTSELSETKESREARAFVKEYERHIKEVAKDGFDEHADPKWVRDIEFSDGHPLKKDNGGR